MSRFWYLKGIVLLVLVLEPACQKRQVAVPVPQPPASSQPSAAQPAATPSQTPTAQPGATTDNAQESPYQVNKPAQPAPAAARKSARPAAPASTSPQAAAPSTPSTAAPAQPPQLGDIVTPDQQRQFNAAIDQSLARAQASLASVANRELTKDQQGLVEQIRNIMQQAQTSRNSDLPGAKSLAARAEVLAKDLAGSFR
jgi:hypothetical protein